MSKRSQTKTTLTHVFIILSFCLLFLAAGNLQAGSIDKLHKFDLSLEYRVMYDASNLPGSGGSYFWRHQDYDFFRQRFRLSLDVQPAKRVGGYIQLEYRGGWGVGPDISDPREGATADVAFNRLKARGVRYGYIYADFGKEHRVQAGIIPVSDGVGDTLFSAAWDFNVGGISLEGKFNKTGYRLGYIRLVDTLSSGVDRDGEFIILDLNHSIFGAHVYYFNRKQISDFPGFLGDKISEGWYALTSSFNFDKFVFDAFAMMNSGKYSGVSHTGYSLKGEGKLSFNNIGFSLMAVYTTGSEDSLGKRSFVTPMGMLNSGGYWAYTHIFTPRESSDVNDFMLDIGNKGAGLFTSQAQFKISEIFEIMDFNLFGGIFSADRERNDSKSMGIELGGEFSFLFSQFLVLDVGASYAHLGDFFGQDIQKDIYEIFARLQLAF